jgi:hypothetical protein
VTITRSNTHIMHIGSVTPVLPMGTQIFAKDTILYPSSKSTLLRFKDIHANGFHVETYLLITKFDGY